MIIDRPVHPVRVDLLTGTHRVDQFECYFMLDLGSSAGKAGVSSLTCKHRSPSGENQTSLANCPRCLGFSARDRSE